MIYLHLCVFNGLLLYVSKIALLIINHSGSSRVGVVVIVAVAVGRYIGMVCQWRNDEIK